MFDPAILKYMTTAQRRHISMLGVQAKEIERIARGPQIYSVIPRGLQIAHLIIDLRYDMTRYHHTLLFQAGRYHNRFRRVVNNQKQNGLICWSDAAREDEKFIIPIRKDMLQEH
ncbi:MAG: hypothetical protein COB33_011460 [Thiotrichaceae bacterium]|nr:hypothetical protein [Thiotrichaceae bacterium]PCI14295.1 MAG: hypothetical protein COB71_02910 [Thiotrichales bacterium]